MKNQKKKYTWIWYSAFGVISLMVLLPLWLSVKISSAMPVVLEVPPLDSAASVRAKALSKRLIKKVLSDTESEKFSANEDELNSLVSLAMRGMPRLRGRINVTSWGLEGAFSLHIPENPFGDYINFRFGLSPSMEGLHFMHVIVGDLTLSGDVALMLGRKMLDLLLSNGQGDVLLNSVRSVEMQERTVTLTFAPIPDLKQRLDVAKQRYRTARDDLALLGDPAIVQTYFERICETDALHVGDMKMSLAWYTRAVFGLATDRVDIGADSVAENRAALLALGIYFGDWRIESMVGKVRTGHLQDCSTNPGYVVLARREDLRLHFVISAALKVISDSKMSSAVGEFKELLDAGRGGSGFSFVDLAADMAGVRLAEQLLSTDGKGKGLRQMLANSTDESNFFPSTDGLPEGLSNKEFEKNYGGVDDQRYLNMVADINARLDVLPVYSRR